MNHQAARVNATKPNHYHVKNFTPVTVTEIKALFGCRVTIEMLIHKDRYEEYWWKKDNFLTVTPHFSAFFTWNRFLTIWSLLHCVNEDNPNVNKNDKIYKSRPMFDYLLWKFQRPYIQESDFSLDKGMIPTKNSLSIKQYIKDKPIRWSIKTFLACESENGYICNAEVYTGRRDDGNAIDKLGISGKLIM